MAKAAVGRAAVALLFGLLVFGYGICPNAAQRNAVHFHSERGWLGPPLTGFVDDTDLTHFYFASAPTVQDPVRWGHATSIDGTVWREHDSFLSVVSSTNSSAWGGSVVPRDGFSMRFLVLWSRFVCGSDGCETSIRTQWTNDGYNAQNPIESSMLFALPGYEWASSFTLGSDFYFISIRSDPVARTCQLQFFNLVTFNSALMAIPAGSLVFDPFLVCLGPAVLTFGDGNAVLALTLQYTPRISATFYRRINVEQWIDVNPIPHQKLRVNFAEDGWHPFDHGFFATSFAFMRFGGYWVALGWLRQELIFDELPFPGSINEMTVYRTVSLDPSTGLLLQVTPSRLRRYQCIHKTDWISVDAEQGALWMEPTISTATPNPGWLEAVASTTVACGFELLVPSNPTVIHTNQGGGSGNNGTLHAVDIIEANSTAILIPARPELGVSWANSDRDTQTLSFHLEVSGFIPLEQFDLRVSFVNSAGAGLALTFDGTDFLVTPLEANGEDGSTPPKLRSEARDFEAISLRDVLASAGQNYSSRYAAPSYRKGSRQNGRTMDIDFLLSLTSVEFFAFDGSYSLTHVYFLADPVDVIYLTATAELYLEDLSVYLVGAEWLADPSHAVRGRSMIFAIIAVSSAALFSLRV